MLAAAGGHEPVVTQLLAAGVPWNAVDRHNDSAGDLAAKAGHEAVYELIVAAGELQHCCGAHNCRASAAAQGAGPSLYWLHWSANRGSRASSRTPTCASSCTTPLTQVGRSSLWTSPRVA